MSMDSNEAAIALPPTPPSSLLAKGARWLIRRYREQMSPAVYAKLHFRARLGRKLNLRSPETFNEKIQWLKLNDANPLRSVAADKLRCREFVQERLGEDLLPRLLWHGTSWQEAPRDTFPTRYVVKASHGSGMTRVVDTERSATYQDLDALTRQWLSTDYFRQSRETCYRGLPRRILVEEMLSDAKGDVPPDYKFFVFHGTVRAIQVDLDRFVDHTRHLYYPDWGRVPGSLHYPSTGTDIDPPPRLQEMTTIAEQLGSEFCFIRVDLYDVGGRIVFGELTNFPGNGTEFFDPPELERQFGGWLNLAECPSNTTPQSNDTVNGR